MTSDRHTGAAEAFTRSFASDFASAFARAFAERFGGGTVLLVSRGRVALYLALRAAGIGAGDEVVVPGYTCVVVPAAVKAAGAVPVFVDIEPATYGIDPHGLERVDPTRVRAVVVQHTYGIPAQVDPIVAWARRHRVRVIEDCCHVFGSRHAGAPLGTMGDAAFFSGQWNKPFSTGLGGMLLIRDPELAARATAILDGEALTPGPGTRARVAAELAAYRALMTPRRALRLTRLYRWLTDHRIAVGSSKPEELTGTIPHDYLSRMAPEQAREGLRHLRHIDHAMAHRRSIGEWYASALARSGFAAVPLAPEDDAVWLRYPVRVANKNELVARAYDERVEIGTWFETPLHPVRTNAASFGYVEGSCPEGEHAAAETINLPTHPRISTEEAERVLRFVERWARVPRRESVVAAR